LHRKEVAVLPLFVGESKVMIRYDASSENTAEIKVGGGGTSVDETTKKELKPFAYSIV